jgi:aspartate kinase
VDGIMTADPQEVFDARNIPLLSYEEIAELAYFGARIIHARMIRPLRDHNIALRVKNIFKPRDVGTVIRAVDPAVNSTLKAVTAIQGISLTADWTGPLTAISSLINDALYQATGSRTEVMFSSQSSASSFVCFIIPTIIGPDAVRTTYSSLQKCLQDAQEDTRWTIEPVTVISVVGYGLSRMNSIAAMILQSLEDTHVLALAQGPSGCSVSIVVDPDDTEQTVDQIHAVIINSG